MINIDLAERLAIVGLLSVGATALLALLGASIYHAPGVTAVVLAVFAGTFTLGWKYIDV